MNIEGWQKSPTALPLDFPGLIFSAAYQQGPLRVLFTTEDHGGQIVRHVSVSCADRYPTWDEIKKVRYDFFSDKHEAIMVFPPKSEYVNVHPNTFHLWAKANGARWS